MDAVNAVQSKPSTTLANSSIQKTIQLRIDEYPLKISKHHHSTHAFVPVAVAALLQEYPTLVSAAVRAFSNKDSSNNKCLRVMRHFPPETRVMSSVRFSKPLYALLSTRPYTPDVCTGWNIPHKNNNAHNIGMKLACGFEILVCSAGGVTPVSTPDESILDTESPKWQLYKQSLTDKGYFRGEAEGSSMYKNLEINAQRFFVANNLMSRSSKGDLEALPLGSIIVKLLSKVNADFEAFKKKEKDLIPADDENWLEVSPDALDELLEKNFHQGATEGSRKTSDPVTAETLNQFLEGNSPFQGADVIPDELRILKQQQKTSVGKNDRKISGHRRKPSSGGSLIFHPQHRKISSNSNASDSSDMSSFSAKVDFNADSFTDALNNILEYSVPEDEYFVNEESDGSSGMSSYEEDEESDMSLSRKTSGGSTTSSKASSGVECPPERPSRKKKSTSKKIPLAFLDDDFNLEEDANDSFKVDMDVVSQLIKSYDKNGPATDPDSTLLSSLNLNTTSTRHQ